MDEIAGLWRKREREGYRYARVERKGNGPEAMENIEYIHIRRPTQASKWQIQKELVNNYSKILVRETNVKLEKNIKDHSTDFGRKISKDLFL